MSRPSVGDLLKQAQKLQEKLNETQESLANLRVEGTAGGGMVTVMMNGRQEVLQIKIEKEVVNPNDLELLEDLIVAAMNQAITNAQELASSEMSKMTGGMLGNIAGGIKLPGM